MADVECSPIINDEISILENAYKFIIKSEIICAPTKKEVLRIISRLMLASQKQPFNWFLRKMFFLQLGNHTYFNLLSWIILSSIVSTFCWI